MDLNKIQITFQENMKIEKIISQINLPNSTLTLNDKIKVYLNQKASQIIKYHNPYVDFNINNINTKNIIISIPYLPGYIFMLAYTITHSNHPYIIYFDMNDKVINVLIPIGKEYQQADTQYYISVINSIQIHSHKQTQLQKNNVALLTAIFLLIENTINTRKYGIQYSQFSILTCENMTLCYNKIYDITQMKLNETEKQKLYKQTQEYYIKIGMELLNHYFTLLEQKNYSDAYDFLKGGKKQFNKYYGKSRLDTFFKNNKSIMGHLEVFISLYELLHMSRMKLLNY